MNIKQQIILTIVLVLLTSLAISGCGSGQLFGPTPTPTPTFLNDEEFAESAREICSTLKTEIDSLDTDSLNLKFRAEAYRRAADALAGLEVTEQSAPQGAQLRSNLSELAVSYDTLDKALDEALTKANVEGSYTVSFTKAGSVYVMSDNISLAQLEIETSLYLELNATEALVRKAAISLGLEECAIER